MERARTLGQRIVQEDPEFADTLRAYTVLSNRVETYVYRATVSIVLNQIRIVSKFGQKLPESLNCVKIEHFSCPYSRERDPTSS